MVKTTLIALLAALCIAAAAPPSFSQQQPLGKLHWLQSLGLRDVNGGTTCAFCAALLGLGGQLAQVHNSTVDEAFEMFCNFLPDKYDQLCRTVIELVGPEAIKLLEEKETSDIVCHAIGLCKNDTGEFCHIFPLPKETAAEGVSHKVMQARKRIGLPDLNLFRTKFIETISITFCDLFKNLCGAFTNHTPYVDNDKDLFSTDETIRGFNWRGKDCNDQNGDIYPGRRSSDDAKVDTNCNGIFGVDPSTNVTYESQWCKGTQPMGTVVLGDSASAHFHIPPEYLEAATITPETFNDLPFVVENECDWPMLSSTTGYADITRWSGIISGPVDSIYLRMRELNRCNHRDYQNIGVNGARAKTMAQEIVKSFARRPDTDNPVLLILALIGNDVCNGHPGLDHMTKPDEMYSSTMETLDYLDKVLPSGSSVIIGGLADGRVLYENLANRIHPVGLLNHDITYSNLYDYMNCLQISPCFGWMNTNATWRNLTYQRVVELNTALKEVVGNFSSTKFKVHYIDTPIRELFEEWVKEGHLPWELIEPVDGFHPGQAGQALEAKMTFSTLSEIEGVLPKPNPFNDKIKEKFGDQGGYRD